MPLLMCPNCQGSMQAIQRSGVEFDMCPTCRGVWLDRGELEKLVGQVRDTVAAAPVVAEGAPRYAPPGPQPYNQQPRRYDDDDDDYRRSGYKKKRGFDLFDIFD